MPEEELCEATETEATCLDAAGVAAAERKGIFSLTFFLSARMCCVLDWVNAFLLAVLALALAALAARSAACAFSSASLIRAS